MAEKKNETVAAEEKPAAKDDAKPKAKAAEEKQQMAVLDLPSAVAAVTADIGVLGKSENNAYGKYKYVPIDKYYEMVPPIARKYGLVWRATCSGWKAMGTTHIAYEFTFSMFNTLTGEREDEWQVIPIIHPLQGAQTTGSAMSYAEKLMMRTTFKIVTGEEDADHAGNAPPSERIASEAPKESKAVPDTSDLSLDDEVPAKDVAADEPKAADLPASDGSDLSRDDWETVLATMTTFIPKHETAEGLNDYWRSNKVLLSHMKENAEDLYEKLVDAFKKHRAALEGA